MEAEAEETVVLVQVLQQALVPVQAPALAEVGVEVFRLLVREQEVAVAVGAGWARARARASATYA